MPGWIDFSALCKSVDFSKVLELYNVQLKSKPDKTKRDQAMGFCPLPGHKGQRRSPSFSVNLVKGIWQCFGCSSKGNVLDFVARMEGLDPYKGRDIRKAAEILEAKFAFGSALQKAHSEGEYLDVPAKAKSSQPKSNLPVVVNQPLDFELVNLDVDHPYLPKPGFTAETIHDFGVGYCNRGIFKDRIVIPIHDSQGRLVAYCGRVINDRSIREDNPKYKLPPPRERDGKIYEFHKSAVLYNGHRIKGKVSDLIVVEGFPSVWWLRQHEYKDVVALMGSDCSEEQAKLILEKVEMDGRIWFLTDGDDAGHRCAQSLLVQLSPYRFVRWLKLNEGEQPTDCGADDLEALLSV